ncbi:MAG: transposase [Candidatus Arsenophonus phytopathogenicus]
MNIVYIDETWVDNNMIFQKCWQSEDTKGCLKDASSSKRFIILNAGSSNGFLPGARLLFKSGTAKGDYHGHMNGENFMKWVKEMFIPNLSPNSIIVMDNAPYHTIEKDKPPTKYCKKDVMITWLQEKGVPFDPSMRKDQLFSLISDNKPSQKLYHVDSVLREHNHTVLRLPPYMCVLNPIELAWAKVKRKVREYNVTGDFSEKRLREVICSALDSVTVDDWEGYIRHVMKVEDEYWEKDGIMEDIMDTFVISTEDTDDDSDTSNEESDESDDSDLGCEELNDG